MKPCESCLILHSGSSIASPIKEKLYKGLCPEKTTAKTEQEKGVGEKY
jgi:hypothetical protein